MLDKTYRPSEVERDIYQRWEDANAFACGRRPDAKPYAIVIPPPNVTGSLHMGHALNNTLQDVIVRYRRMQGYDVLWQPGTDHAGIATQMVVERQLEAAGQKRRDLGRDAFVEKVWDWKAESGGTIIGQLRRLGASCDWSRERFTMDEGLSRAVRKVFVQLYKDGLVYRDKRLVNWDPKLHTAISDLEVESRETAGNMWYFRYPVEGEAGRFITVATTRPETMLGDSGVAVHPDDERYAGLIGKHCILPLVGRRIPIVADDYADPEQGSGAVKITPAHDFNDFEVGRRQDLEVINIFDENAALNENVPEAYRGLDRFEARKRVVAAMEAEGFLDRIEPHTHMVPFGDRSGVVIEPWLTDQWFVDAKTLARPAIEAVESGRTRFVPKQWENTYYEWMRNIQPWCVSRQLWWGHQIPAWFGPDGTIFVEESEEEATAAAEAHYGKTVELTREEDVLDTWFSSALWPFSTLGWPDETPEVARYYPTGLLVTGFDIIFFWVARMMMMGLHFMKEIPFDTVYIHALVRDEQGQKMSKSKGNVIDPLELIEKYGADALRFTLIAMEAQGRDIKLAEQRVEGYRNFGTKLWNAARFCEMNECAAPAGFVPTGLNETLNRWIVGQLAAACKSVEEALAAYRYNDAAAAIYGFTWGTFCDWYLELAKPLLQGDGGPGQAETRATAGWVLDQLLKLMHPFMPFITETLWARPGQSRDGLLMLADWPVLGDDLVDAEADAEIDWLIRMITGIRAVRTEMNVPPGARVPLILNGAEAATKARLERTGELLARLARVAGVSFDEALPKGAIQTVVDEATLVLPLADVIDIGQERDRLAREIDKCDGLIAGLEKKLGNEKFVSRAPAEIVEAERARKSDAEQTRAKLAEALGRLTGSG
ncbi:valine--tRNA ligase [Oceanibacterium hippocampi]|uniref:Valine--tRNA ligase n=1 Tax=Oceanibacterium hippocampi TaxID=745714 RepID=A0A1Y5TZ99_9PROT|nr:valine--tRNA ligase [Oceanibacterium hippocampi]SLN77253.1 Valine--tRNA ligase [Oceanibacterium hippocampi]